MSTISPDIRAFAEAAIGSVAAATLSGDLALPPDLAGWIWDANDQGVRLVNLPDGYSTSWWAAASTLRAIEEARAISAREAAVQELGEQARHAVAAYAPGPDAGGVYRRPPSMAERLRVAPASLIVGRWQPRKAMRQEALDELIASVQEHGVIEDLLALVNEAGALELIAGHRRQRAALAAALADVPVKVLEITASQARSLALISNDQREDLSDLERGQAYEQIIAEEGISEAELARRLGRNRAYIQQRRTIAQAAPDLQQAFSAGQLGFTQARAICQGSGGDHEVQCAVVAYELRQIKADRPSRAEDLQERAERTVRERADVELKKLGWKRDQYWQGNTLRHFYHAPTVKPAEWTSAEILVALREFRRPPAGAKAAPLAAAEKLALERCGWKVAANTCAPWTIIERGKALIAGDAGDLAEAIAAARAELDTLAVRFVRAGWAAEWNHKTLKATPPPAAGKGGKLKMQASIEVHSLSDAERLIKSVEKGTWAPDAPAKKSASSNDYRAECVRCKTKVEKYVYVGGGYACMDCKPLIEAEEAAQRAKLAGYVDKGLGAWLDSAPEVGAALLLLQMSGHDMSAVKQALADPAQRGEQLRAILTRWLWNHREKFSFPAPAEGATAVAAPDDVPAPAPAEPEILARPEGLDALIARLALVEEALPGATSYGMVIELGNRLGDISDELDRYADSVSDLEWDVLIKRMGEASAVLDDMALATTQREAA